MNTPVLKRLTPTDDLPARRHALAPETLTQAESMVRDVRERGEPALREYAERFDALPRGATLVRSRAELEAAFAELPEETRDLLTRTAARIQRFAEAQRECLRDLTFDIPGGTAGHTICPLNVAGCYAPGGRYPLVSSMLMTAVTARAAGVTTVWAASPNPTPLMLAAAALAGADGLLAVGGAQAIAALAYGVGGAPACDAIVGPGNRWVTAAKHIVSADVRIDMLAGPSELLILADHTADPVLVAADLLAQAEHDVDARPMLLSTSPLLIDAVDRELTRQLETLPTRDTAAAAVAGGFAMSVPDLDEAVRLCNRIAPEHLELHVEDADRLAPRLGNCGCMFVGSRSAEVLGDYGAGPNHTLPTGGTARFTSGLSVHNFLRQHTWIRFDSTTAETELLDDAAALARIERLEAHARSAELRRQPENSPHPTRRTPYAI